ncbi:hypothetical protein HF668_07555 [Acidithiobacillus ferridurans]|uniref:hypothetical protein n=1 Tax=Acidithiobacillus ferridurans TaxID=1232575 RepID=UPI001C064C89|nr:hypothetical protein [Acidithiobacillus ferridurans]MBU2805003.1 hypothetical protein [Acidithiobacillus ferridurans]
MTYTNTTKKVYENANKTDIGLCMTALGGCEVHFRKSKDEEKIYAKTVEHKQRRSGALYAKVRYLEFNAEDLESKLEKYDFYDYQANAGERAHILWHIIDGGNASWIQ